MRQTTSSLCLRESQTRRSVQVARWSFRALLLGLIVSCACEAIAAKPARKVRPARREQIKDTVREGRAAVAFALPRSFESQEPFLPRDLLGAALWGAYVGLGLTWFGSSSPRKPASARRLATRA
jgi:hypothetical protein